MAPTDRHRFDEALDWVRRLHDPDFDDWDAHIAWLEASVENAAAFDTAAFAVEAASEGLAPAGQPPGVTVQSFANDNAASIPPVWRRYAPAWGLGIAATLVAIATWPSLTGGGGQSYDVHTLPGEQRVIALADGTQMVLNGDSSVRLNRRDPRTASVERGEILFNVRHDAAHPFVVHAGDAVFQDAGTIFDVVYTAARTHVAVREGAVLFDPQGAQVRLGPGRSLQVPANGSPVLQQVDPATVGGWRAGRLTYFNAPIRDVAEDMSRALGDPVTVSPAAAKRRFSGVIMLDPDHAKVALRAAAVTGLVMEPDGSGWRMRLPKR